MVATFLQVIKMPFKVIYSIIHSKKLSASEANWFVYFKYPWKTPGKNAKKVLENPGFFKL